MKNYTLVKEHPDHFLVHNGVAHFKVAKAGLSEPTADKIRAFAAGGEVHDKENLEELDNSVHKFVKEEEKEHMAEGGKLSASDRKHLAPKNFAGPDRSYPIEDASHARNALARVSQHGSPELQAQVREKVHSKYPGIEQSKADGGEVQPTPSPELPGAQSFQDSFRKATNSTPAPEKKAMGGDITNPAHVYDISKETKSEAIRRYADGNPANLAKGGQVSHHAEGKYHFHFYDGAAIATPLDKEMGAHSENQPSPLDDYVKMADGGQPAMQLSAQDVDPNAQIASPEPTQLQKDMAAAEAGPSPEESANNLANTMGQPAPFSDNAAATPGVIPPSQQISAKPQSAPVTADQNPTMLSDLDKNLAQEKAGIESGAAAQSQGYKDTAKAIGDQVLQQKQQMDEYKIHADQLTAQNEQLFNAVASSKVDPNHFWNSKSTGGKIAASIGIILGGIGGGANGTNQNLVLSNIQNQIQQDIDAQKNDQSNKMNLYKMGLEKYRDAQSAQQFATLQSNALLQGQLQKIAAQTGSQTAVSQAQQMIGQIGVQSAQLRSELAMKQAAMNAMNQPQQVAGGVNSDKLRLLINAGVIPKEEVPAAMKEYGDYSKLSNHLDETDKIFQDANKDATYSQRIADALPLGSHIPTVRPETKQYLAETNLFLDKMTKDLTGRVTPQSMANLQHSLPVAGDDPATRAKKLNDMKDIIRGAYDFPTLKSYRLLHPNDPVATSSATREKKFSEAPPK